MGLTKFEACGKWVYEHRDELNLNKERMNEMMAYLSSEEVETEMKNYEPLP